MEGAQSPLTNFESYRSGGFFDELYGAPGQGDRRVGDVIKRLSGFSLDDLESRSQDAERELYNLGITFLIYSDQKAIDRILPFDLIPRIITSDEFDQLQRGIAQRVQALNLFLKDIYNDQKILKDGIIPTDLVLGNSNFCQAVEGLKVPHDSYVNILGVDLVRDAEGTFRVLEDNCRCPSGVSYVVENRQMMRRILPELMRNLPIAPVETYGAKLQEALAEIAPEGVDDPRVVLLSPGTYNSAYFEHVFLAREMGAPLVEGRDLIVEDDKVYMRTTGGLSPVHAIYRRIDDDFLDPKAFRPDSMLGVPGLLGAVAKGNVGLANAIGTGVADDKAVYAYMPRVIRYYLDQDPIIDSVPTNICREEEGLKYTLDHLDELVIKPVGEAGGYGITIGPKASKAQLAECRDKLIDDPANYISQPLVSLSVSPTLTDEGVAPRHVDLRPFAVTGKDTWVLPGGLTRVALRKGAIVVNSSQGGGSKDTWVLG